MIKMWTASRVRTVKRAPIDSAADLDDALGYRFILLAGSAISGVAFPYLPMTNITNTITRLLETKLTEARYSDQLYAHYARRLADGYGQILIDTLFEEFLGKLADASNRRTLNELLRLLYCCQDEQYGPNHEAIAHLLQSGRCRTCFTTNFDTAIETACKSIQLDLPTWDVIKHNGYPDRLPSEGPLLVKMHGNVINDTCVAESREILAAQSDVLHGPLEDLLKDRRVFVVGYSGTGDIDISRHFKRRNICFLVAKPTAQLIPAWSERLVLCDLSQQPTSSTPNLLRQLAGLDSISAAKYPEPRCAEKLIEDWIRYAPIDTQGLIRSLLDWRKADALLHLNYADRQGDCHAGFPTVRDGLLHVQRGAYQTALRILEHLPIDNQPIERVLEIKGVQAFAHWRLGRWKNAREILSGLLRVVESLIMDESAFSNEALQEQCFNVCRVYIEVCVDDLQLMPPELARRRSMDWDIKRANELLKRLHHPNPQDRLLAQIADCQVEWVTERRGNIRRLSHLFFDCIDRQYLNSAWAVTRLALQVSFRKGRWHYNVLSKGLSALHRTHYIWKNRESLFIALVTRPRSKLKKLRYSLAKGLLTLLYKTRTGYVELKHKHEVSQWAAQQRKWKQLRHIT